MTNSTVTKGSAVEVGSNEPGFDGAWYTATVVDEVDASPTKKKSSGKKSKTRELLFIVKYDTLIQDDNTNEPLTEVVNPSLVRPLPPRNVRRNNGKNATAAELVAEEEDDGDFEVHDVVDAYHRDGWWVGVVKNVILEGEMKKYVVLFENPPEEFEFEKNNLRFHVDWVDSCWLTPPKKTPDEELGDTNADSGFTTPAKETETNSDVVTYSRNKRNVSSVETGSRGKRFKSSTGGKRNTKAIVSVLETSGSDDINEDSLTSHRIRRSGRLSKLSVNKPIGLLNDTHNIIDVDEEPLSVWFQGMHPLKVLKKSSCFRPPGNSPAQAIVVTSDLGSRTRTTATTTDYQKAWPFIKHAPIWDSIESLKLYQTPPQRPHFSPLKNVKEEIREGLAIGHMVTFGGIVQRLSGLQLNDSVDVINSSLETLSELESHGFDVGSIRARLTELVLLKSKAGPCENKRKEAESNFEKRKNEKCLVDKELDRLQVEMKALKEKIELAVAMQKEKEEEVARLKTSLDLVSKEIKEWEIAFENVCKQGLV